MSRLGQNNALTAKFDRMLRVEHRNRVLGNTLNEQMTKMQTAHDQRLRQMNADMYSLYAKEQLPRERELVTALENLGLTRYKLTAPTGDIATPVYAIRKYSPKKGAVPTRMFPSTTKGPLSTIMVTSPLPAIQRNRISSSKSRTAAGSPIKYQKTVIIGVNRKLDFPGVN